MVSNAIETFEVLTRDSEEIALAGYCWLDAREGWWLEIGNET